MNRLATSSAQDSIATAQWPDDVSTFSNLIVNLYFVGDRDQWTLIDAGLPMSAGQIIAAAEARFGPGNPPQAIVLTHGHFDHVGSLKELLNYWNVPVWAHALEAPYLTGRSPYPPPDPTVGGGMMAWMSPLYPRGPIDVTDRLHLLPPDGSVPSMPGWSWIHTPGHSPGHVSFFRESDRTLIVGDAFVTTKQESAVGAVTKFHSIHGPPKYYTCDWAAARESVMHLARLRPSAAFTGHGVPIAGETLENDLATLVARFDDIAMPSRGRYVDHPAITGPSGIMSLPRPIPNYFPIVVGGLAVAAFAGYALTRQRDDS